MYEGFNTCIAESAQLRYQVASEMFRLLMPLSEWFVLGSSLAILRDRRMHVPESSSPLTIDAILVEASQISGHV